MNTCHKSNCYGPLIEDDVDDRQEWCRRYYHCPDCKTQYERCTDYKTQSSFHSLVESDVLYMIDEKGKLIEVE